MSAEGGSVDDALNGAAIASGSSATAAPGAGLKTSAGGGLAATGGAVNA